MAQETVISAENSTAENADLWSGGKQPFKASYGKLMMWYFLLSDAFTFAGFLIAYGALRFSMPTWPVADFVFKTAPGGIENGPLIFVTFMTFVLIVSSVTVLRAVQEGKLENTSGVVKWLIATIVGGGIFLGCQAWEWNNLIAGEGVSIYTNPFSAHVEEGKYLTQTELDAHATAQGWIGAKLMDVDGNVLMTHDDTPAEITYYNDGSGNLFFPKLDHHKHSPKKAEIKEGTPYLITYDHDIHDYMPAAYETTDASGQKMVKSESFGPKSFGTLFFFITGFHGFHVFSGLVILAIIAINTWSGFYVVRRNGHEMVEKVGLYWHFVDLVWVFVFLVFYLI